MAKACKNIDGIKLAHISMFSRRDQKRGDGRLIQGHILVVDDECSIVDVIAEVFESEGLSVDRARNGIEAMKAISRRRPDLVVADVLMPFMDGMSLARKIQKRKLPIPVV